MNRLLLILIIIFFSFNLSAKMCPLKGFWKSNESMTLASLRAASNVTEKQRELFNNAFFGKLFVRIECSEYTLVLEDWFETTSLELISENGSIVVFKYSSILEDCGYSVMEASIEDDCYSVPINSGQFREYFCPTTEKAYNIKLQSAKQLMNDPK